MSPNNGISKLDFPGPGSRRPLLQVDRDSSNERRSQDTSYAGSFFEQVAEGIQARDRKRMQREVVRYFSFVWALVNCSCAGSITAYSLYGGMFQKRLGYSQYEVNWVSIAAELAMYLPVPGFGYLCDRYGPRLPSLLSGFLFGLGYLLAAFTYKSGPPVSNGGDGWPIGIMIFSFVCVGMGTCCMYVSAVSTCAKNFGRGKNKGVALALPIAAFGLSGMWQSQVGDKLLYERLADGSTNVDVFKYFLFLGILLLSVGTIGLFALQIVNEAEMIDEAIDELEQSGFLSESEFFSRAADIHGYGTLNTADLSASQFSFLNHEAEVLQRRAEEEARKKTWLLNEETRRFLTDQTMWYLAAGFFLLTGPGEAYINNVGTIIPTLYPPGTSESAMVTRATHVGIIAVTSTAARILTGIVSDILSPIAPSGQHRRDLSSSILSLSSLPSLSPKKFTLSRIVFLLAFAIMLSIGQILLASGAAQNNAMAFGAVSTLIGAGYGATFSLIPIIISVVWGVENFGTNWGIVATMPALGATVWGALYAAVYQKAGEAQSQGHTTDTLCYGTRCYAPTFWGMAVSVWIACGLWLWAWKGVNGWYRRGIAV
ncbi:MFS monocarboxylic acid transporter-like protein [Pseudovirgaria hyperparasitica]|uniref:Probable transporter MCH1 n=1 Tax=Pseudovirgaria hyperparasitica TaxID=470096 RepID=A0A6A6WIW7_9PEZI|nr:MFS monocarboxylic acid transporter-like protein [Pseudovirgaria hyperparasitica]KAF2762046.1 MFS monocarboxylic acid transporter-like protein [Pseudovirgaria hyperparasitica]